MNHVTCAQLQKRPEGVRYDGTKARRLSQAQFKNSRNPAGTVLPEVVLQPPRPKFFFEHAVSMKGMSSVERDLAETISLVAAVNHTIDRCNECVEPHVPGFYCGRHLVRSWGGSPVADHQKFMTLQINRRDKQGNALVYLLGTMGICGNARGDEGCLLLASLMLQHLGLGVSYNREGPSDPGSTCNPGGLCLGLAGGICTHLHVTYLNATLLPSHCTSADLYLVFPGRVKIKWVKSSSAEVSIIRSKAVNATLEKKVSRALSLGKDVHLFQCVECDQEQLYTDLIGLRTTTKYAKYPQLRNKIGKLAICRNQEYEHRILYSTGRKTARAQQFFEYMGPKGAEDFASSTSDEDDEEAAVPQIQELPGSGGEELPFSAAGFPEHVLHRNISQGAQLVPKRMFRIRKFFLGDDPKTSVVPTPVVPSPQVVVASTSEEITSERLDEEREAPLSENPLWMGADSSEEDDQSQDDDLLWTSQELKRHDDQSQDELKRHDDQTARVKTN